MIIFVFGMPRSGKTTYIKEHFPDFKHIDVFRFQKDLPPGCSQEEREVQMMTEYEACKQALIDAIKTNENVVLEHTLLKAIRRTMYIEAVRDSTDQKIIAYVFNPDIETILRINGKEDSSNARERVEQEKSILEIPVAGDDFTEVHIITEPELPDLSEYTYSESDDRYHNRKDHAKTVILPAKITELKHDFYDWSKVENFHVDAGNKHYSDIDGVLFNATGTILYKYPEGRNLTYYTVPEGVTIIKHNAFADYKGMFARFAETQVCGGRIITLAKSLEIIEDCAFCSSNNRICSILVHEDNPNFTSDGCVLFDKTMETLICCPSAYTLDSYSVPDNVKTIKREGFSGCVNLKHVTLPPGLSYIGSHAFEECVNLLEIDIPGTVKIISPFSFSYCFKLTNVTLNEGTESIEKAAFAMCNFIKNMIIPRSVVSIEKTAISAPPSLTIHCYEDSYAHAFAQEENISFSLIGDTLPGFNTENDTMPGLLRIENESLNEQLMGNPEIAELLEKIAGMAGPLIIGEKEETRNDIFQN